MGLFVAKRFGFVFEWGLQVSLNVLTRRYTVFSYRRDTEHEGDSLF